MGAEGGCGLRSQPDEGLGRSRVVLTGDPGEQIVADPRSRIVEIRITGIVAKRLAELVEEGAKLEPRDVQKRTQECDSISQAPARWDSPKPLQTCSSDDAVKDRLGLIVSGMSHDHGRGRAGSGDLQEPGIARVPGVRLEVTGSAWLPVAEVNRKSQLLAQIRHEIGVGTRGVAADAVIEVGHGEREPQARS